MFRIAELGSEMEDRRKKIYYFSLVDVVIFCAALSEFDLLVEPKYGDESFGESVASGSNSQNALADAITLFDSICNNQLFAYSTIILLLNKKDLLREKLTRVTFADYFPDYQGLLFLKLRIFIQF